MTFRHLLNRTFIAALATCILLALREVALPANQTDTLTPIVLNGSLPYRISLQPYDFGSAPLPTLHSYAAGHHDGKWVLLSGKSNGLHGFETTGPNGFEPEFQNREVWVIDPVSKQSWRRSLEGAGGGLTTIELNSLTSTNNQFYQSGERLYMTGGYGVQVISGGLPINGTFDRLSAINLPGIVDWVMTGNGVAKDHIRQITSLSFRVTGGAMYEMDGRTHLVFGQDFTGNYNPNKNGTYTNQVRSFTIVDDGKTLSITNPTSTTPDPNYRRRDLNVFPVIQPGNGDALDEGLVVLSGVFTPPPNIGAWTVPVEIDSAGNPTMPDPTSPATFKQGFNNYHSAKLGLFSEASGEMHELLFGGISLQFVDTDTMQTVTDDALPFINDITSIVIDSAGNYSQHWLGQFPTISDLEGKRLRFGANAEFFLADGIETFANGVIKLDELNGATTLGYIFGGIIANGPHTRSGDPPATSSASNIMFTVVYVPVPEPRTAVLALVALGGLTMVVIPRPRRAAKVAI
ncbi:MAG TPA: hypothetical protein VHK01_05750 [Lacipirellulaceae bacterium]|nr:hypothetical protein [Lacipirellulaceae bacterium]